MNVYRLHSVVINNVSIPMKSVTVDPGIQAFMNAGGASVFPTVSGKKQTKPMLTFQTEALASALDTVSIPLGLALTGVTTSTVILYFAKFADSGSIASGSVHKKLTMTKGMAIIKSISGKGNEAAVANIEVHAIYDGTNAPFVVAESQALPGSPAILSAVWCAGPVDAGGTAVESQGISLDLGQNVRTDYKDGIPNPVMVGINNCEIKATVDTLDAAAISVDANVSDLILYFRKRDPDTGDPVADATAEHIAITIASCYQNAGSGSLNFGSAGTFSHMFTPVYNGTDAVIAVDTTAAIA